MTTTPDRDRGEHAGPDPDAIVLLERVVGTPLREHLPPDVAAATLRWARIALIRATTERLPWGRAFGLEGAQGQEDGLAVVRRRIRDRQLAEAGELLLPGASAAAHARELARVQSSYAGVPLLEVESADLAGVRLLRQAESIDTIPTSEPRLAEAIRHGRRIRETGVSRS